MKLVIPVAALALVAAAPATAQQRDDDKRPVTVLEIARELGISGDDVRPERQLETRLLGKPLIIGGEIGGSVRGRKNFALVRGADDDDVDADPELKIETIWLPGETTAVFASTKLFAETRLYEEGGHAHAAGGAELSELWLLKTRLFGTPFAVQAGRQQIQERREWWWDEDLDAIRLHYFGARLGGFVSVARDFGYKSTLGHREPQDKDILRYLGHVRWTWADRQELGVFALHQDDRSRRDRVGDFVRDGRDDESDADLTWLGLRARGRVKAKVPGKFYYWADVARVRGTETLFDFDDAEENRLVVTKTSRRRVAGWAFDAGASFELPFTISPYLTLGFARGSGDRNQDDGRDHAFRQTGLHNNNGKFRGNSRFRYYGEVLRPDLSNIAISTVALGAPLGEHDWIEAIWHRYRQIVASDRISGSRLDMDPNGESRRLGDGFDLIVSHRPPGGLELELTAGGFRAGRAFGAQQGRWAGLIEVKADLNF